MNGESTPEKRPPPSIANRTRSSSKSRSPFMPKKAQRLVNTFSNTELEAELDKISSRLETTQLERSRGLLEKRKEDMLSELAVRGARTRLEDVHLSPQPKFEDVEMDSTTLKTSPNSNPSKKLKAIGMQESLALEELAAARDRQRALTMRRVDLPVSDGRPTFNPSAQFASKDFFFPGGSDDEDEDFDTMEELRELGLDLSAEDDVEYEASQA